MRNNPAVAIVAVVLFSLALSFSIFEAIHLLPVVFLMAINYKNIAGIIKSVVVLNLFIIFLALFVYFETNFYKALDLFIKVNCILLFNLLLFYSSSGFDIVRGFMALKFNKKFILVLFFTVRSILDLMIEFGKIKESLKARNFKPKTDLFTYKTYGNLFGKLFLFTIKRSQKLEETLVARGFKNELFLNYKSSLTMIDFILLALIFILYSYKVFL